MACDGKTGGVFYAIEALFFDGGDELAVADNRSGSVAVVGIDSQNVHGMIMRRESV